MTTALSSNRINQPHTSTKIDKLNNTLEQCQINETSTDQQQAVILGALAAQSTLIDSTILHNSNNNMDPIQTEKLSVSPGTIYAHLQESNANSSTNDSTWHYDTTTSNSPVVSSVARRTYSNAVSPSPEPDIVHMDPIHESCIDYSNETAADFMVTLNTESNVSYKVHVAIIRKHSEFFDGVLTDEPDRQSIELQFTHSDVQFTSGDIKLYFDMLYDKVSIAHISADKTILLAQLCSYFESTDLLQKCEKYLTNVLSPQTLQRTISQPKAAQSSRMHSSTGFSTAAIQNNNTLTNLALADRLHMNELKSACINDLVAGGLTQYKDDEQLNNTLQQLSNNTLTEVLQAVIEQKY